MSQFIYSYKQTKIVLSFSLAATIFIVCVLSKSLNGLVLNRCVSALPQSTCPFIPSRYLQQIKSRSTRDTSSPIRFPDTFAALSQVTVVEEPVLQCEERRLLGSQILNKKAQDYDSMLTRFVGNLIRLVSNQTSSQEVSFIVELAIFSYFPNTSIS